METNAANPRPNPAPTARSANTAALASELILISSVINNLNRVTSKKDSIYIIAATIGLASNYLIKIAAIQEANEQQIAPGVTTFANNLKLISSSTALIAGILSYWALLIEASLRAQGIPAPQTPGAVANATISGSLLAQ
ncbi:hypothetical protein [Candidatus Clostridium radicumherbarum]|uniref:Uncharacterized protein n=1 Tax=Candidatus Clostridium radicumherbarum TaxID=3381662 RepID=A0ABW8TQV7_9CLOT